jgi:osmotically-inducible protein OsmY
VLTAHGFLWKEECKAYIPSNQTGDDQMSRNAWQEEDRWSKSHSDDDFSMGLGQESRGAPGRAGRESFAGRGPRGYKRSDGRIEEDINERLTQHGTIDATDIEVSVQNAEVTLSGTVDSRQAKRLAEDIADSVSGVKDVVNQIKIQQRKAS